MGSEVQSDHAFCFLQGITLAIKVALLSALFNDARFDLPGFLAFLLLQVSSVYRGSVGEREISDLWHTLKAIVGDQAVLHPWIGPEERVELALVLHGLGQHDVKLHIVAHDIGIPELGILFGHVDDSSIGFLQQSQRLLKHSYIVTALRFPQSAPAFFWPVKPEFLVRHLRPEWSVGDHDGITGCHGELEKSGAELSAIDGLIELFVDLERHIGALQIMIQLSVHDSL